MARLSLNKDATAQGVAKQRLIELISHSSGLTASICGDNKTFKLWRVGFYSPSSFSA